MRVFIVALFTFAVCAPLARGQDAGAQVVADVPGGAQFQSQANGGGWTRVPGIVGAKAEDGSVAGSASTAINGLPSNDGQPVPESRGASASGNQDRELELAHRVSVLENQVAKLRQSNSELIDIANNHSKMLRDIATGTLDGEHYVPNVTAISEDPKSREKLVDTVVHDITRSAGTLEIHNNMNSGQSLVINGVDTVYVGGHSIRNVAVPSGTATTELVGAGEGTRSWAIGPPNYVQIVIIGPAISSPAVVVSEWHYDPLTGIWWRTLP